MSFASHRLHTRIARAETATAPNDRAVRHAQHQPGGSHGEDHPVTPACLTPPASTLAAARKQAERAAERYAQLLAAEAIIAARAVYPAVARLVFRLADDVFGSSATLVAAYTAQGRRLWHIDIDEEWPDESLVNDRLAAAADWCDDYFETVEAEGADEELYVLDLDE